MKPIGTVDYHTEGEPFRIVERPPMDFAGGTVAERRVKAINDANAQQLRQFLCYEPRGHADMYGGFVVPPNDSGADFGVLFWHKDGFSTACGHGTMALGIWAIESGRVVRNMSGVTDVTIDVPSGRVTARVSTSADGRPVAVEFVSVPSYVLHRGLLLETSRGEVGADVVYGGALYAHVKASEVGLSIIPENYNELISIGREVKWNLNGTEWAEHPSGQRLSGIYGTILFDDLGIEEESGSLHQRNVTVFADGQVDRSPCGSGTCSRVAALAADGSLGPGQTLIHDSIVSTRFHAQWRERVSLEARQAVIPHVTSMAFRTGRHTFEASSADPLGNGFVLR